MKKKILKYIKENAPALNEDIKSAFSSLSRKELKSIIMDLFLDGNILVEDIGHRRYYK